MKGKKKIDFRKIIKSPQSHKSYHSKTKDIMSTMNTMNSNGGNMQMQQAINVMNNNNYQIQQQSDSSMRSMTNERSVLPDVSNQYMLAQSDSSHYYAEGNDLKKNLLKKNQGNEKSTSKQRNNSLLNYKTKGYTQNMNNGLISDQIYQQVNGNNIQCLNCMNVFTSDKVKIHERTCIMKGRTGVMNTVNIEIKKRAAPKEKKPPAFISRPRTLICYICGREYGTASLQIHLKTCIKKWEIEESFKPPHQRRPVPEPPKNFDLMIQGARNGSYDFECYNEEAFKDFNEKALVPCHNCARTFLPDRLVVHLRSCDKDFARKRKLGM
ncbi:UNKNOWN [Stylonychia lemnae]|uniref:C2HC/C3H-type domain-containing protein n=1 Tax=Stylonychia lemnae TaxID=5949 RepID=A0A078AH85_STYLE|nr:UNKNOWN [Stylonychia lemnae]|eukprot:CDW81196.1 UNKNOWN [Stylonychia lemnae]